MANDFDTDGIESSKRNSGYVSIYRSIQDHWVWADKPFSKGQAWIDLLLMVNFQDNKVALGTTLIDVKRGSRITSIRQLCDRWQWSNSKVRNFLKMLQDDGMASIKSDACKTVITVEKYALYQDTLKGKTTAKRQVSDTQATRKHLNNKKNKANNVLYTPEFEEFYSLYPNSKEKNRTFNNWETALKNCSSVHLITAAKNYSVECEGRERQFIKSSANFLGREKIYLDYLKASEKKTLPDDDLKLL